MDSHSRRIDWLALAKSVGAVHPHGESGGTELARAALDAILGEENIRAGIDEYISGRPGGELVRSVLWLVHSPAAMSYCYELYARSDSLEVRQGAVELLRVVGDGRVLPWVREFLADPDPNIQLWGFGVLDQLLWSGVVDEVQAQPIIEQAASLGAHLSESVATVRGYLLQRQLRDELFAKADAGET